MGSQNLVNFNANKTQCCLISRSENKNIPDILFGSNTLKMCDSLSMLGVSVAPDLSWNEPMSTGEICSNEDWLLIQVQAIFLTLYKAQIRTCLEYGSHL